MIVYQIRHKLRNLWRDEDFCLDDSFLIQEEVDKYLWLCNEATFFPGDTPHITARVQSTTEIDIESSEFVPDARPWAPESPQAVTAARMCGRPASPQCLGYSETMTTVILDGEPRNLHWRLVRMNDSYAGFNGVANHYAWQMQTAF